MLFREHFFQSHPCLLLLHSVEKVFAKGDTRTQKAIFSMLCELVLVRRGDLDISTTVPHVVQGKHRVTCAGVRCCWTIMKDVRTYSRLDCLAGCRMPRDYS